MADLENEKRFLNELRDENGVKVGPKILEFFLENENATVIGVPGSGKTTILQVLKKINYGNIPLNGVQLKLTNFLLI